ncbi:MAG: MFS transporter [Streptosporangiales bacterium]|nr:MFS transporter [Streptosporangiales bacterium]
MSLIGDLRAMSAGRDFRRLLSTRLISQFADGVFQAALAGYVFFSPERQTVPAEAAAAFAVLLLPYSVLGPFAGVFIDRWSRRQVLLCSAIAKAVLVAITVLLVAGGPTWAIYLSALAVLSVNRFLLAALSAALPHVVERDRLVTGNAATTTAGTILTFLGAGVGAGLRLLVGEGAYGTGALLLGAGLCWLTAAAVIAGVRRDRLGPGLDTEPPEVREAMRNVARGLAAGLAHLRARPAAALALGAITGHRFLYGIATLMTALLYRNTFHADASAGFGGFAIVIAASGAGYFAAAILTPIVTERISTTSWITLQLAFAAVVLLGCGLPFREALFPGAGFALGVVSQGVKICVDTIVQRNVDDAFRGRVFSVYDMLFNAGFVAAAAVGAAVLPPGGRSVPVLLGLVLGYALLAVGHAMAADAVRSRGTTGPR